MNKLTRCDNCRYYNTTKGNEYTFCGHEKHAGDMVAAFTVCPEHEFENELQPCPFCGAQAIIVTNDNEEYKVACGHCGISQKSYTANKDTASVMWNRRAYK